ncbi:MAG: DUF3006 domain-containing protein [Clostridiales bacterium]|nr:DUF3006 domain-containing protein [Clostridiales bacterium]
MEFIINRFESGFAVCESKNGKIFNVPAEIFENAQEGDVIRLSIDKKETAKRKAVSQTRLASLFGKDAQKGK